MFVVAFYPQFLECLFFYLTCVSIRMCVYLACIKCSFCLPCFYAISFVLYDLMLSPTLYTFLYLIFCVSTVRLDYPICV